MKRDFKMWFFEKYHMPYPGMPDKPTHVVMQRVAEAMAEWAEVVAQDAIGGPQAGAKGVSGVMVADDS